MTWKEIEFIFNRAIRFSFSKKKMLFLFPVLACCGLLIVFFRTLGVWAGKWVSMSLVFLPVFLCTGILLAAGIFLTRIYHNEVKGIASSFRATLRESWNLMVGIAYLSVPLILGYLVLWTALGIFYLLKEIPVVGPAIGVVLSFGPFLLVLASLILGLLNLSLLFFLTPGVALKSAKGIEIAEEVLERIKHNAFSHAALFFFGLLPLLAVAGVLSLSAVVTGISYLSGEHFLSIALQWFFIMLPFSALLAPAVVFFFNFAAECHVLMQKKAKAAS